jgi:hypothetical protein
MLQRVEAVAHQAEVQSLALAVAQGATVNLHYTLAFGS